MTTLTLKAKLARAAAVVTVIGIGAGAVLASTGPASADPPAFNALVGVGSDTTQDIMNALSGNNQNTSYLGLLDDTGNPKQSLVSFDALNPPGATDGCITTKLREASFVRPNGSGGGQRALSRALDGGAFGPSTNSQIVCGEPAKPLTGLVDFARSSSAPSSQPGTVLQFIPFARDGLSFGYVVPPSGTAAVTLLTRAQLTSAFTNATPVATPTIVNGVAILPCGIQTSSGTFGSWNSAVAANTAQEDAATVTCRTTFDTATDDTGTGRIQENQGNQLRDKATINTAFDPDGAGPLAPGDFQVIIGFSASNFVAQNNGVVASQLPAPAGTVSLGSITNGANVLGLPYTGTVGGGPASLSASATFYADTVFGREVFNVVSFARIRNSGSSGMKELFISNPTASTVGVGQPGRGLLANHVAVICRTAAQTTVQNFGFLSLAASRCGTVADNSLTAPSRSGTF